MVSYSVNATAAPMVSDGRSPALAVEGLTVEFRMGGQWVPVVDDVSFSLSPGETLGLVGESGSGKTVTSLAVMGLLPRNVARARGSARLRDMDLLTVSSKKLRELRGGRIAMVFQEPMTSLNPAYSIGDQIAEAVRLHKGASRRAAMQLAYEALDNVGIPEPRRRARQYPHEFSGGMRQRAMLAMALSCEPDVLIADEPTTALDVTVQAQILQLLKDLQRSMGLAILFVTHDLGVVAETCDRVSVMYAGQVVETASVDDLFEAPRHPYTAALLAARPGTGSFGERLRTIPGRVPPPGTMVTRCRFSTRCEHAQPSCAVPVPLTLLEGDREVRCVRTDELGVLAGGGS